MTEKSFQAYFLKSCPHAYRTSLTSGSGFPDILMINGPMCYSLVELKMLLVGPSGNKKLKSLFKPSQPPWYFEYLHNGGDCLYVAFQLNKGYGLLHVTKDFVRGVSTLKYLDLLGSSQYKEYKTMKEMIEELEVGL